MFRRRHRYAPLVAQRLGNRLGVDGFAAHLAMQQFDPASRSSEERAIAAAYESALMLATLTGTVGEQLWLPADRARGHRRLRRALTVERAQRPTVFLVHALGQYGADRGTDESRACFAALRAELLRLLPLDREAEQALDGCRALVRAEHEDVSLPPGVLTGLVLARQAGEPISAEDREAHINTALRFFACQSLRVGVAMLLERGGNREFLRAFAPFDFTAGVTFAAWALWDSNVRDLAPIARGARDAMEAA